MSANASKVERPLEGEETAWRPGKAPASGPSGRAAVESTDRRARLVSGVYAVLAATATAFLVAVLLMAAGVVPAPGM